MLPPMTAVAGNVGEWSLGALNAATPWLPLFGFVDDPCFIITGTFVGTIAVRISNEDDYVKTRFAALSTTYTAPSAPQGIPRISGRWYQLIMTAYTSGTAFVGISRLNSSGKDSQVVSPSAQLQTNYAPLSDYFINPAGDP